MNLTNPFILDGATGSNLFMAGMPSGVCVEEWILDHPDILIDLQRSYLQSGSQAVLAPTFGANRKKLSEFGLSEKVAEFNHALAALSKKAAEGRAQVFGDVTPSGSFVYPYGDASMADLIALYDEQISALAQAGVDGVILETQMTLADVRAATIACRKHHLPFLVSVTVDAKGRTLSGCDLPSAMVTLQAMGAQAVGLNCSMGPAAMVGAIAAGVAVAKVPVIAKPNAGLPVDGQAGVYHMTPAQFADEMALLVEAGASIVGGCCGTTPEHIAALKEKLACQRHAIGSCEKEYLAREGKVFEYSPDMILSKKLAADVDLADHAAEAMDDGAELLLIEIANEECVENLSLAFSSLMLPVCFTGSDAGLMNQALLSYQGRAAVLGSGLGKCVLEDLNQTYGAIIY